MSKLVLAVSLPTFGSSLLSLSIARFCSLTICPLFEFFLFFSFWFYFFIAYISTYSSSCFILIFYQKLAIFCFRWFSIKSLHGKPYRVHNGGTFLSSKASSSLLIGKRSPNLQNLVRAFILYLPPLKLPYVVKLWKCTCLMWHGKYFRGWRYIASH